MRIYILEMLILGPAAYFVFQRLSLNLSPLLSGPLVFTLVLLAGDLLLALVGRDWAARYLDDALKDSLAFASLGIVAGITYQVADLYLDVRPNLGLVAVVVFVLFLGSTERAHRYR